MTVIADLRARGVKRVGTVLALALFVVCSTGCDPTSTAGSAPASGAGSPTACANGDVALSKLSKADAATALRCLVDQARSKVGLTPYSGSSVLNKLASTYATTNTVDYTTVACPSGQAFDVRDAVSLFTAQSPSDTTTAMDALSAAPGGAELISTRPAGTSMGVGYETPHGKDDTPQEDKFGVVFTRCTPVAAAPTPVATTPTNSRTPTPAPTPASTPTPTPTSDTPATPTYPVDDKLVGSMFVMATFYCPANTIPADGQLYSTKRVPALFKVIGTTYGGDGINTFQVPEMNRVTAANADSREYNPHWCIVFKADPHPGQFTAPAGTGQIDVTADPAPIQVNYVTRLAPLPTNTSGSLQVLANDQAGGGDASLAGHYLGELVLFTGEPPQGYAKPDGSLLTVSENIALFSIMGVTYGGDGRTTFALPKVTDEIYGAHWAIATLGVFPSRY